jgi:hypothetical protein
LTACAGPRGPSLVLLTRPECGLCEQMLRELQQLASRQPLPAVALQDVDDDPQLQRRYGLKIPVLLLDGAPVCHGRLDAAELLRLLKPDGKPAPA